MAGWEVRCHIESHARSDAAQAWAEHVGRMIGLAGLDVKLIHAVGSRVLIEANTDADSPEDVADRLFRGVHTCGPEAELVSLWLGSEGTMDPPNLGTVVGVKEIAAALGTSPSRASRIARTGGFPAPIAVLGSGPVWNEAAVMKWGETWQRRAGRRPLHR